MKFKNSENTFDTIGLSKSTIYVKINRYKLLKNYPHFKQSSLSAPYMKNNFKKIMSVK